MCEIIHKIAIVQLRKVVLRYLSTSTLFLKMPLQMFGC